MAASAGRRDEYREALRGGIHDGRNLAAVAGISRLRAEFASMGLAFEQRGLSALDHLRSTRRAVSAAASHTARVLRIASREGISLRRASDLASGSLRRIGVTETSESFNRTRTNVVRLQLPRVQLFRVWDAALDKRTCPICERSDGIVVTVNGSFPAGEPGAVHPQCRCNWTLLRAEEVEHDMIIRAA